jgi:hypothetical protein
MIDSPVKNPAGSDRGRGNAMLKPCRSIGTILVDRKSMPIIDLQKQANMAQSK